MNTNATPHPLPGQELRGLLEAPLMHEVAGNDSVALPVRASMGMLTQPISFLGLPVVTVPLRTASGKPIGLQLIAAPFNEQACLRAARALEAMGITDARVAESAA